MKDLFMFMLVNMVKLGQLKSANYYGENFASVQFEADNKVYSINISSCDNDKEKSK